LKRLNHSTQRLLSMVFFLISLFSAIPVAAHDFEPTIKIPVIFYDFHADQSNPNFEPADYDETYGGLRTGMIKEYLSVDKKPIFNQDLAFNSEINKWFRPSGAPGAPFEKDITGTYRWDPDYLVPYNNLPAELNEWQGINFNPDDPMANVVIYDSLEFILIDTTFGIYQFESDAFFPLDSKIGFGKEPKTSVASYHNPSNPAHQHNYSFTMELHTRFTYQRNGLYFNFVGDDDVWAFINGKLEMDLGGIHGPETGTINLDNLQLVDGQAYDFDFFYCERHVTASRIKITTNLVGQLPPAQLSISDLPDQGVCAGKTKILTAEVRDIENNIRPEFYDLIQWSITPQTGSETGDGQITTNNADTCIFTGTRAYTSYKIKARLPVPQSTEILFDSLLVSVNACSLYQVIIEQDSIPDLWTPQRREQLTLSSTETDKETYAFIRDHYNNLVGKATGAGWSSTASQFVSVQPRAGNFWIGDIQRQSSGSESAYIIAAQSSVPITDSVLVQLLAWRPIRLRLVNQITGDTINPLTMTTSDTAYLRVEGLKSTSDTGSGIYEWAPVDVAWILSPDSLSYVGTIPQNNALWTYNPTTPGTGVLQLTHEDANTPPLSVPVFVRPGPIDSITLSLIDTIANPPTAGEEIQMQSCIYNDDGLFPEDTCILIRIHDILTGTNPPYSAKITIGGVTKVLTDSVEICYQQGCADFSVTLYYAPPDEPVHTLIIRPVTEPPVQNTSGSFVLQPGVLTQLVLSDLNYVELGDSTSIPYPSGTQHILPVGYDAYNNRLKSLVSSHWTKTGNLQDLINPSPSTYQYILAESAVGIEAGWVRAEAVNNAAISDSMHVTIPGTFLLSEAYTRDANANGYLDGISLHFDTLVTLPSDSLYYQKMVVTHGDLTFHNTGLIGRNGTSTDSVFILNFSEQRTAIPGAGSAQYRSDTIPQTSWKPYISYSQIAGLSAVTNQQANDGAGPVVWSVERTIHSLTDRRQDEISIRFSERVLDASTGDDILESRLPADLFTVWNCNLGECMEVDSVFAGIPGLHRVYDTTIGGVNRTAISFMMSNNHELLRRFQINIDSSTAHIIDTLDTEHSGNEPLLNNVKTKVSVLGVTTGNIFPNPSKPGFDKVPPGEIRIIHEPAAREWVRTDGYGTVIQIGLTIPPSEGGVSSVIRTYLKIYDIAGNLVQQGTQHDLLGQISQVVDEEELHSSDVFKVDIYWNGSSANGMAVAPGVYRVIVMADYEDPRYNDIRISTAVGISR